MQYTYADEWPWNGSSIKMSVVWMTMGTLEKISEVGEYAVLKISELLQKLIGALRS
jgi:hypothetical protein